VFETFLTAQAAYMHPGATDLLHFAEDVPQAVNRYFDLA
jgi:hypothetical protein